MVGGMRADRERQSMTIHDCHDFHAFPALRRSDLRPATLRHHERRIDEAFHFIQGAFVAKLVGYIHQHSPQNFIAAPGLKAPMNGFVVRIALRQHVPLRAGVEYPQYSFENTSGRDRLASRTSIGDVLFRKMIPDALPLLVCQSNSSDIYSRSTPPSNFEIGSSHSTDALLEATAGADVSLPTKTRGPPRGLRAARRGREAKRAAHHRVPRLRGPDCRSRP